MKKLINLWIIGGFAFVMLAFYGSLIFWAVSCEKDDLNTQITTAPGTEFKEAIDTIIPDHKANIKSVSRSGDGYYDFVIIGYNYKGQNGMNLFLQDKEYSRYALMYWFGTFDIQYKIDTNLIRVTYVNTKKNLSCNDNVSLNEGVLCNEEMVMKVALDAVNGQFTIDRIGVFMNEKGSGGSNGSNMFFVGLGNHVNQWCGFNHAAFDGKMWHELSHTYYYYHVDSICNKGAGTFTTNGCCGLWNCPVIPFYQDLIKKDFNQRIN